MNQSKANILVVDDTLQNLRLLIGILNDQGYDVRPANSGQAALMTIMAQPPDLILLDIQMPEMNGYEVCTQLKANVQTREIPVIFISALNEVFDKVKAFAVGGVDYITKPFHIDEVLARVQTHLTLRQLQRTLQERVVELDAFAHTAAHDLKTPLATIVGYSGLLIDAYEDTPAEIAKDQLQTIAQTARKMAKIIDEMLTLATIRQTKEIATSPIHMGWVLDEVQNRLKMMIAEYEAEIVVPEQWPTAVGHAPWIEEVWANYISNALKYGGRPSRVVLGADVLPQSSMIRFWVRDNGHGLSVEDQDKLFTKLTRLHQEKAVGHGLGLSIVQRIVNRLGGEVGVDSEIGQGSRFWFTLPASA